MTPFTVSRFVLNALTSSFVIPQNFCVSLRTWLQYRSLKSQGSLNISPISTPNMGAFSAILSNSVAINAISAFPSLKTSPISTPFNATALAFISPNVSMNTGASFLTISVVFLSSSLLTAVAVVIPLICLIASVKLFLISFLPDMKFLMFFDIDSESLSCAAFTSFSVVFIDLPKNGIFEIKNIIFFVTTSHAPPNPSMICRMISF